MSRSRALYSIATALLLLSSLAGGAVAEEEKHVKRIEIKKIKMACEDGEDCQKHVIIHSGDGDHGANVIHFGDGGSDANVFVVRSGDHSFGEHGGGGHLGVALSDLTPELRAHFGVPEDVGVLVSKVLDDSPALQAGLQVGDIVTAVDGEEISGAGELARAIRSREAGDVVVVEAWRDGKLLQINATLDETEGVMHAFKWRGCEDGDDCDFNFNFNFDGLADSDVVKHMKLKFAHAGDFDFDFGCNDGEDCKIEIRCEDEDDCECTVNGESADCPDLEKLHGSHD